MFLRSCKFNFYFKFGILNLSSFLRDGYEGIFQIMKKKKKMGRTIRLEKIYTGIDLLFFLYE